MDHLMDIRELAEYLKLDRQTLYNWLHQRKLSGIKVGGVWRFDRRTVDAWLRTHLVEASAGPGLKPGRGNGRKNGRRERKTGMVL